jgi:hypothetical protein
MSVLSRTGVTLIIYLLLACAGVKSGAAQGLYISEVAANYLTPWRYYHTDSNSNNWLGSGHVGVAWIEVFNRSPRPVKLSDYRLRTWGLDRTTIDSQVSKVAKSSQPVTFDLPPLDIPAGGYFVLAGKTRDDLKPSDRSAYIQKGDYLPYWSDDSGFVELLTSNGDTADFVRFGSETEKPVTQGYWRSNAVSDNVAAFPSADAYSVSHSPDPLDRYDRSIVRLSASFKATKTKND